MWDALNGIGILRPPSRHHGGVEQGAARGNRRELGRLEGPVIARDDVRAPDRGRHRHDREPVRNRLRGARVPRQLGRVAGRPWRRTSRPVLVEVQYSVSRLCGCHRRATSSGSGRSPWPIRSPLGTRRRIRDIGGARPRSDNAPAASRARRSGCHISCKWRSARDAVGM